MPRKKTSNTPDPHQRQSSTDSGQYQTLQNLQEMFKSQLDPDLVASVLAEHEYNVDAVIEVLIILANENPGSPCGLPALEMPCELRDDYSATTQKKCRAQIQLHGHVDDGSIFASKQNIKLQGGDGNFIIHEMDIKGTNHSASAAEVFFSSDELSHQEHVGIEETNVVNLRKYKKLAICSQCDEFDKSLVSGNELVPCSACSCDSKCSACGISSFTTHAAEDTLSNSPVMNDSSIALSPTFDHTIRTIYDKIIKKVPLLVILRGLPGSGKSTLANQLKHDGIVFSTDDYFKLGGQYVFDRYKLSEAHEWNKLQTKCALEANKSPVIIDNTNTEAWEMKPYIMMGLLYKYDLEILEPNTSWKYCPKELAARNSHGVSKIKIEIMLERYEHKLTLSNLLQRWNIKLTEKSILPEKQDKIGFSMLNSALDNFENEDSVKNSKILDKHNSICMSLVPRTFEEMASEKQFGVTTIQVNSSEQKDMSSQDLNFKSTMDDEILDDFSSSAKETNKIIQATSCSVSSNESQNIPSIWDIEDNFNWDSPNSPVLLFSNSSCLGYEPKPQRIEKTSATTAGCECVRKACDNQEAIGDQLVGTQLSDKANENKQEIKNDEQDYVPLPEEIEQLAQSLKELILFDDASAGLSNLCDLTSVTSNPIQNTVPENACNDVHDLQACFPSVAEENIRECKGDDKWVTNILSDPSIIYCKTANTDPNYKNIKNTSNENISSILRKELQMAESAVSIVHQQSNNSRISSERNELINSQKKIQPEELSRKNILKSFENNLIFRLEPAFAQQLEKLFGNVSRIKPSTETTENKMGLEVAIDVDLAHQLHKSWIDTQRYLQEGITDTSSTDSACALPLMDRLDIRTLNTEQFPNLNEHMTNEHTEKLCDDSSTSNKWQFPKMDLATKLRKQQLQEYFPGIPVESLDEIFCANNCIFSDAVNWLLSSEHIELTELEHQMLEAVKMDSMRLTEVEEHADTTLKDCSDVSDSNIEDDNEEEQEYDSAFFYAETRRYYDIRQDYFNKAREAYNKGIVGAAMYYSQQAHLYTAKLKEASADANRRILSNNNMYRDSQTLDLHLLYVRDAMYVLKVFLETKKEQLKGSHEKFLCLDIITGKGSHSTCKIPKIKLTVLDYLSQHNFVYWEKNPGLIQVKLTN